MAGKGQPFSYEQLLTTKYVVRSMIGQGANEGRKQGKKGCICIGIDRMIKWITLVALNMVITKMGGQWFNMCTSPRF